MSDYRSIDDTWAEEPWKTSEKYFMPFHGHLSAFLDSYVGQKILDVISSITMGKLTGDKLLETKIYPEVIREAQLLVMIDHYQGISRDEKIELLRKYHFTPNIDKDRVYVFFESTYSPECDSYVYWD